MTSLEKSFLKKIEKNLPFIAIGVILLVAFYCRFSLRGHLSGDASAYLLPWYEKIKENGLYSQVGDYNMLYQFIIWILTKIPLKPLYSYKILSCLFDILLATFSGYLAYSLIKEKNIWNGILVFSAILLCPTVYLNSAAWAQCDSIFVTFIVLSLYFLVKKNYINSFIFLGLSFAFKLHAIFILPLYFFVYYAKKDFSIVHFLIIPVTMLVAASPLLFWGRNIIDTFSIYLQQTTTYPAMTMNYPSIWMLLCDVGNASQYDLLKTSAILFTFICLMILMIWWIKESYEASGKNLLYMGFMLSYTCVFFLPAMHERYGYIYEILAIIIVITVPKTLPLCCGLIGISLSTYGIYLFQTMVNFRTLTWYNLIIYICYLYILGNEMKNTKLKQ